MNERSFQESEYFLKYVEGHPQSIIEKYLNCTY